MICKNQILIRNAIFIFRIICVCLFILVRISIHIFSLSLSLSAFSYSDEVFATATYICSWKQLYPIPRPSLETDSCKLNKEKRWDLHYSFKVKFAVILQLRINKRNQSCRLRNSYIYICICIHILHRERRSRSSFISNSIPLRLNYYRFRSCDWLFKPRLRS